MAVETLPSLIEVEAERGKRSLLYFMTKAWDLVEPARYAKTDRLVSPLLSISLTNEHPQLITIET